MQFTRYYSALVKASGVPHLNMAQFQLIHNIIALEIRIHEQGVLSQQLSGDAKILVGKRNYHYYNKLHNLTQGKDPKTLFSTLLPTLRDD